MKQLFLIAIILVLVSTQTGFFQECVCPPNIEYDRTNGTCGIKPDVENCSKAMEIYGKFDPSKCGSCNHNFHKENDTTCTEIKIDDRIKSCISQHAKEICTKCSAGNGPYNGGKKCGKRPSNCQTIQLDSEKIVCTACKNKYTLNGTKCELIPNTIVNCEKWTESTKCQECDNKYYKETEATCANQDKVTNCNSYFKAKKGCQQCDEGFILSENKCVKGNIENCVFYSLTDQTKCQFCKRGYQLDSSQITCIAFTKKTRPSYFDEYCQTYDHNSKCIHCLYDYKQEIGSLEDGDYKIYPKYGFTNSVQYCAATCPDLEDSSASILSFIILSLSMFALLI